MIDHYNINDKYASTKDLFYFPKDMISYIISIYYFNLFKNKYEFRREKMVIIRKTFV